MKPFLPLFQTKFEMIAAIAVLGVIFLINTGFKYLDYIEFKSHNWVTIRGNIVNITHLIAKNGREYQRLSIKNDDGLVLGITYMSKEKLKQNMRVGFRIKTNEVDFISFFAKRFYATTPVLVWANEINDTSVKSKLQDILHSQHKDTLTKELYGALFLATPISKTLREQVQRWGIAHIIAISGFHLSILFGFLYFMSKPVYTFFQSRYFPYRNVKWDLSLIIFIFLGYYLWLIDMTPSFLRSYAMGVFGFLFLWRGIHVLSFEMLFFTSAFLVAFFPQLIFNIGFILSVFGVFFIFVFIKHFGKTLKVWQSAILLNFWLFAAMNPIVHYWFGVINLQQWASIPLSIFFIVFYPAIVFLHAIGFGGIFDNFMVQFLSYESKSIIFNTPFWLLAIYLIFAALSVYSPIFMFLIAIMGIGYFSFFLFS
ncbi:MAG: ComEC/Rec2 family competence protein [Campylobacteraceae bacterium]|jgi:competence protein ComEC|nr:ComEC/Rec2 family competence protein [Campylobacteraceae bacterium]